MPLGSEAGDGFAAAEAAFRDADRAAELTKSPVQVALARGCAVQQPCFSSFSRSVSGVKGLTR